jgi:tetratricopeptide (TPR) repeat protein
MFIFVAMPFTEECTEMYEDVIKPTLIGAGCEVMRADEFAQQQNIIKDILDYIVKADLVIADLTAKNPNVFYELGLAHAFLRPTLVITQDELDTLPFDLKSYRAHRYSLRHKDALILQAKLQEVVDLFNKGQLSAQNPVTDFLPAFESLTTIISEPAMEKRGKGQGLLQELEGQEPGEILDTAHDAYLKAKDYSLALSLAEIVLKHWPTNGDALDISGSSALRLGKLDKAIQYGQKLIELEPLNWRGYSTVADAYMIMGRSSEAIPLLEKELKYTNPNLKVHVLGNLGKAHEKTGNIGEAVRNFEAAANATNDAIMQAMMKQDGQRLRNIMEN